MNKKARKEINIWRENKGEQNVTKNNNVMREKKNN